MKDIGFGYNERLFPSGFRSHLHFARFKWVSSEIKRLNAPMSSVIALGCFDGKLIGFLLTEPDRYVGFDANWEGGLDIAWDKWAGHPNLVLKEVTTPDQMNLRPNERFDMWVWMETLEHVPPALVDGYLETIARHWMPTSSSPYPTKRDHCSSPSGRLKDFSASPPRSIRSAS